MAQYTYRANLANFQFPLLSEDLGSTVLVGTVPGEPEQDNTPAVVYCENMMPTREGAVSVGFYPEIPAVPGEYGFKDVRIIFGNQKTRLHFAVTTSGLVYVLSPATKTWVNIPFSEVIVDSIITTGTVNGVTYIFFSGVGCYIYNENAASLSEVTLTSIDKFDVVGITASSGYLVAYTRNSIAWSSTIYPTDFTPSEETGAGGGSVADIDGDIFFAVPNDLGFLIYSEANVVSATFTGNRRYPFKFREVTDSKGAINLDLIAYEANAAKHFTYSKAGIQAVDTRKADTFLPAVTDFLAGRIIEDYDTITSKFTRRQLSETMKKKIKYIASRYLIISYGEASFEYALIYDVVLQKLGKIKLAHVDVFEYIGDQQEIAKGTIAFLLSNGQVKTLEFSPSVVTYTGANGTFELDMIGTVILGRFQYVRSRVLQLEEVSVANTADRDALSCKALVALGGKQITSVVSGYLSDIEEAKKEYNFHCTGKNMLLALSGKMDLNDVLLTFTVGGDR